jgi:hypothetical protein
MSIINNCATKIFKYNTDSPFCILTYLDFNKELTTEFIYEHMNKIVENNPILKKRMDEYNNSYILNDIENYDVKNYITIKKVNKNKFNNYLKIVLKQELINNIFLLVCCIDKVNKISRIYLKINHAYMDGYKLIDILIKPFYKKETIPKFNRETSLFKKWYHYVIGTYVLLLMNIKIILRMIFNNNNSKILTKNSTETDYILCNSFSLKKIKEVCKKKNITVNDFLYAMMIKTDNLYTKKSRNIQICCPINVSNLKDINNMSPILNYINNSLADNVLFEKVHNFFDNCKYSLFIPFISLIIDKLSVYFSLDILIYIFDYFNCKIDYVFTNIIGPPITEINNNNDLNISDIHFLLTTKMDEIIFNIISCDDKINIICSFKKGRIVDKKRFEKCIYKAYNRLLFIDNNDFA